MQPTKGWGKYPYTEKERSPRYKAKGKKQSTEQYAQFPTFCISMGDVGLETINIHIACIKNSIGRRD